MEQVVSKLTAWTDFQLTVFLSSDLLKLEGCFSLQLQLSVSTKKNCIYSIPCLRWRWTEVDRCESNYPPYLLIVLFSFQLKAFQVSYHVKVFRQLIQKEERSSLWRLLIFCDWPCKFDLKVWTRKWGRCQGAISMVIRQGSTTAVRCWARARPADFCWQPRVR